MNRRRFLQLSGAALAGAAGCVDGNSGTDTPTDTPTPTVTPTPTPEPGERLLEQNIQNRQEILGYMPQEEILRGTLYHDINTQRELAERNDINTRIEWNNTLVAETPYIDDSNLKLVSFSVPESGGNMYLFKHQDVDSEAITDTIRDEHEIVHEYRGREMFRRESNDNIWFFDEDEDLYVQTSSIDYSDESVAETVVDALEGDHPTLDEPVSDDSYQEFPWYDSEPFNNEILLTTTFGDSAYLSVFTLQMVQETKDRNGADEIVHALSYDAEDEQASERAWVWYDDGTIEYEDGLERERELEEILPFG